MMNECDDTTDDYYDIFKHLVKMCKSKHQRGIAVVYSQLSA